MKIYQWRHAGNISNKAILDYKWKERKTWSYIFMDGRPLPYDSGLPHMPQTLQDPKDYDLVYHAEVAESEILKWDSMPNNGQAPLVNQRTLQLLLDLCPEEFQYFPVTIVGENPKLPPFTNHDYFLINIIQTVEGIDIKKSDISYFESGNIDWVKKLILKEKMPPFFLRRFTGFTVKVIASHLLVKAFKKEKITGVRFEPLGETTFIE